MMKSPTKIERVVMDGHSLTLEDLVAVAGAIRRNRGITLNELCAEVCLTYGQVARYAGMLETDGLICTDLLQRCSINVKIV